MDTKLEEIKALIKDSKRIVFLGGAGVSTASGIPDFRSPAGSGHRNLRGDRPDQSGDESPELIR